MKVETGLLAQMMRRFLRISAQICLRNRFMIASDVMEKQIDGNSMKNDAEMPLMTAVFS